jgi:hypothetical protein
MAQKQTLLRDQTSDVTPDFIPSIGGELLITSEGTFGGGVVTIELSNDGVTALPQDPDLVITAPKIPFRFAIPEGIYIRAVFAGSSGASVTVINHKIVA